MCIVCDQELLSAAANSIEFDQARQRTRTQARPREVFFPPSQHQSQTQDHEELDALLAAIEEELSGVNVQDRPVPTSSLAELPTSRQIKKTLRIKVSAGAGSTTAVAVLSPPTTPRPVLATRNATKGKEAANKKDAAILATEKRSKPDAKSMRLQKTRSVRRCDSRFVGPSTPTSTTTAINPSISIVSLARSPKMTTNKSSAAKEVQRQLLKSPGPAAAGPGQSKPIVLVVTPTALTGARVVRSKKRGSATKPKASSPQSPTDSQAEGIEGPADIAQLPSFLTAPSEPTPSTKAVRKRKTGQEEVSPPPPPPTSPSSSLYQQ